jgi:hypothetical protein
MAIDIDKLTEAELIDLNNREYMGSDTRISWRIGPCLLPGVVLRHVCARRLCLLYGFPPQ